MVLLFRLWSSESCRKILNLFQVQYISEKLTVTLKYSVITSVEVFLRSGPSLEPEVKKSR